VPATTGRVMIGTPADLDVARAAIAGAARGPNTFPTAMGHAPGHAARLIRQGPACGAASLDVARDGGNNWGAPPSAAERHVLFDKVTVNARVLAGMGDPLALVSRLRQEVLPEPAAFPAVADGDRDEARDATQDAAATRFTPSAGTAAPRRHGRPRPDPRELMEI
jgi:hypothetical protein